MSWTLEGILQTLGISGVKGMSLFFRVGFLKPHLIVYANKMTQGGGASHARTTNQVIRELHLWDTVYKPDLQGGKRAGDQVQLSRK